MKSAKIARASRGEQLVPAGTKLSTDVVIPSEAVLVDLPHVGVVQHSSNSPVEDTFFIEGIGGGDGDSTFSIGIFDGHGGAEAAHLLAGRMPVRLREAFAANTDVVSALHEAYEKCEVDVLREVLTRRVHSAVELRAGGPRSSHHTHDPVFNALAIGSCGLVAVVRDGSLYVANSGDARAVLGRRVGPDTARRDGRPPPPPEYEALQLTNDHNTGEPARPPSIPPLVHLLASELSAAFEFARRQRRGGDPRAVFHAARARGREHERDSAGNLRRAAPPLRARIPPRSRILRSDAPRCAPQLFPPRVAGALLVTRAFGDAFAKGGESRGHLPPEAAAFMPERPLITHEPEARRPVAAPSSSPRRAGRSPLALDRPL
eukprot:tig00000145_g8856.t1